MGLGSGTAGLLACLVFTTAAWGNWPPEGQAVRAEVTRDAWVSDVGRERDGNNGGAPRLKTKGTQEFFLVDIDPRPLAGRVVTGATLHLRDASPDIQRRLTVSTLASDWVEGTSSGYKLQKGSVSFNWAEQNVRPWAFPGSDLTAVCNGAGNTIWRFADASAPDKEGWQVVAIEPAVVAARVAGISYGFVVMDDVGTEYLRQGEKLTYRPFLNRFVCSREEGRGRAPYMTVYLGAEDREAPDGVEGVAVEEQTQSLPPGEAMVSWKTPADHGAAGVAGFAVRVGEGEGFDWEKARPVPQYLVPLAAGMGQPVQMHLRDLGLRAGEAVTVGVRAVDRAGNVSAVKSARIVVSSHPAALELAPSPAKAFEASGPRGTGARVEVSVIDALDKVHPVSGVIIPQHGRDYLRANHLWSASGRTIRLYAARNEFVDFQVMLSGQIPGVSAEVEFDDAGPAAPRGQLYRFRHVNTRYGLLPDPLLPLTGPISIPSKDEAIANQKHAAMFAEIYVPHEAKAGLHTGRLTLKTANQALPLKIELHVWDFVLPDYLSFVPEMNCYGLPDGPSERAYYRLAHIHRTCLNRLGYNWRGEVNSHAAPRWTGEGFDWSAWDQNYGPILDGSAFADLPRKSVPVDAFYLQLNENWPFDVNKNFKGGYWADQAFEPGYRRDFADACGKMADHLNRKGWHDTFFEFYLNNKIYYKGSAWSASSAPWIFDEPVNTQDFWALRFYGMMFHEGIRAYRGEAKLAFRCDISRPEWQRDILDGVLDVNVVGGEFGQYRRMVVERASRNRQVTINYGGTNPIEDANTQPVAWCLDSWMNGADGVLPWQTIGNEKSWTKGDELSLFYPGGPVGSAEPIPSVRLKAYRRGQQDVEYLTMLSQISGEPRWAVAGAVRAALKLSGTFEQKNGEDAGLMGYAGLTPEKLWELRIRVGSMLDKARPPAKRKLVDLRTPARDVSRLPEVGLVTVAPGRP